MKRLFEPLEPKREAIERQMERHFQGRVTGRFIACIPRELVQAEGTHQAVMKLPSREGETDYVIKVVKHLHVPLNRGFITTNPEDIKNAIQQETNARVFRKLGFAVVPHIAVWLAEPKIAAVAAPDLTAGGNRVEEAHGFDFTCLKNGLKLKEEFDQSVKTFNELNQNGHLRPDTHITQDEPNLAFEKLFHVILPKPKILGGRLDGVLNFLGRWIPGLSQKPEGTLVIGDLDHTSFSVEFLKDERFRDEKKKMMDLAMEFQNKREPGSV